MLSVSSSHCLYEVVIKKKTNKKNALRPFNQFLLEPQGQGAKSGVTRNTTDPFPVAAHAPCNESSADTVPPPDKASHPLIHRVA